jgi:hypothetical protein
MTDPDVSLRGRDFGWTARWLRAEALIIFLAALVAYGMLGGRWPWFFVLFLAPDLSLAGYLGGARVGAVAYNAVHAYLLPVAIGTLGAIDSNAPLVAGALIWTAHIALDRALGYGLKLKTAFGETHLGRVGRAAAV